ncbi:MAG: HPr family phosphocarrier protein [Deltaproteobacteria bacterium]|nr:HPr family phosphocarrier protein [Deltaproteobacteria bacterium]
MDQEQIKTFKIINDLGLHGRAAAKIVELAGQYKSKLFFKKDGYEVDGSSILSILTLACQKGTEIQGRAVGEDAEELMAKLDTLFGEKFGENK